MKPYAVSWRTTDPCPYCWGDAITIQIGPNEWEVSCGECDDAYVTGKDPDDAHSAWNLWCRTGA